MLHKILAFGLLKSTQGGFTTFLAVVNKSAARGIFFNFCGVTPLTCAENPVYYYCCAGVAQLVEQLIRNQQVAGSSPATSSNAKAAMHRFVSMCRGFIFCCFSGKVTGNGHIF